MRTVSVTLNGEEVEIRELRVRANEAWLQDLEGPAQEVMSLVSEAMATDVEDADQVQTLVRQATGLLSGSMGRVADLMVDFAPYAEEQIEQAYTSELIPAFLEVVKLALPFDAIRSAMQEIQALQTIGSEAQ
jgi:hypothetical protein